VLATIEAAFISLAITIKHIINAFFTFCGQNTEAVVLPIEMPVSILVSCLQRALLMLE